MEVSRRIVLAQRPSGAVDEKNVRLEEMPVPKPGPNQVLGRVRFLSIDPTIRTWMNDAPGYLPPIGVGEVIRSSGIAEVISSNSDRYKVTPRPDHDRDGQQDQAVVAEVRGPRRDAW